MPYTLALPVYGHYTIAEHIVHTSYELENEGCKPVYICFRLKYVIGYYQVFMSVTVFRLQVVHPPKIPGYASPSQQKCDET